jgi:hypothetical protein
MTQVSGKTAYNGMGMENVLITVYRQEQPCWQQHDDTRSGYHGSFIFSAPDGTYRLVARTDIRMGTRTVRLEGAVDNLVIQKHGGRIDRVVINLLESP